MPFEFLKNIKIIADLIQLIKTYGSKEFVKIGLFILLSSLWLVKSLMQKDSNLAYHLANTKNQISGEMKRLVKICGDKSSIMISVVSLDKKGVIDYFYSCDDKNCPINTKETNEAYNVNRVVDDSTYAFLQEIGIVNQIQTINLIEGEIILPIAKKRVKIEDLPLIYQLLTTSNWYNLGELKILKISSVVDFTNAVIYIISFTSKNECFVADNTIASLKETINESRKKNAFYHP